MLPFSQKQLPANSWPLCQAERGVQTEEPPQSASCAEFSAGESLGLFLSSNVAAQWIPCRRLWIIQYNLSFTGSSKHHRHQICNEKKKAETRPLLHPQRAKYTLSYDHNQFSTPLTYQNGTISHTSVYRLVHPQPYLHIKMVQSATHLLQRCKSSTPLTYQNGTISNTCVYRLVQEKEPISLQIIVMFWGKKVNCLHKKKNTLSHSHTHTFCTNKYMYTSTWM